jgi:hypothetical protein
VRTSHELIEGLQVGAVQRKHDGRRRDFPQPFRRHGKARGIHPDFGILANRRAQGFEPFIADEGIAAFDVEKADPHGLQAFYRIDQQGVSVSRPLSRRW